MNQSLVGIAIAKSLFSFGLMAVIAMAAAGMIHVLVAGLAALSRRDAARTAPIPAPPPPAVTPPPGTPGDLDPAVVAAISAAVYAVIGAHRIVYIGETQPGTGWTAETRLRHHGSHAPHTPHGAHHDH